MQKTIKIRTKDNHYIHGGLYTKNKKPKGLVIFCHGFTGNQNEHQFFNGSIFFTQKGYNTFRFNFYGGKKGERHFEQTSISQHGSDITTVINYFKDKSKKIYLIGHSYGGTSILFSDTKYISAIVFWDASYVIGENEKKDSDWKKIKNRYCIDWGMSIVVGNKFVKELFNFPDCGKLISKINSPIKFIGAGRGIDAKKYYKVANRPKGISIIKDADHGFNTPETEKKLFEETYSWIKKF